MAGKIQSQSLEVLNEKISIMILGFDRAYMVNKYPVIALCGSIRLWRHKSG